MIVMQRVFSIATMPNTVFKIVFLPLIEVLVEKTALNIVVRTSSSVLTRNTSLISGSSNLFLCFDVKLGSSVDKYSNVSHRQYINNTDKIR